MLAMIEEHRLVLLCCRKIFVGVVAIVKEVQANLVEQQRRTEDHEDGDMQAAFLHISKITILNCLHGRS